MLRLLLPCLLLTACLPSILKRSVEPLASLPEHLPELAPCALVHTVVDEDLSNAANGFEGEWKSIYSSFLIRHPEGVLLVDAAFGTEAEEDIARAPWWFRKAVGASRDAKPLSELLAKVGVKPEEITHVLLTHAHWDHTGGLVQLPNAKVLMPRKEAEWILNETDYVVSGAMPHHLVPVKDQVAPFIFSGPAYDGFEHSHDVFGDGSVVAVPTPGHTLGATSWFVNSGDGHRWLFAGDAAWVKEGFETPVMKDRFVSTLIDADKEQTADSLGHLHAVFNAARATVVTSHDERTWVDVPRCIKTIDAVESD